MFQSIQTVASKAQETSAKVKNQVVQFLTSNEEEINHQPDRYKGDDETVGTVDEMLENLKEVKARWTARFARASITAGVTITAASTPAAAAHGTLPNDCTIPEGLTGLFTFLHGLSQILLIAGIGVAVIGISVAAIYFMLPGQDKTQRAKQIVVNVVIGTVLLLSANGVISWVISQFGSTICVAG